MAMSQQGQEGDSFACRSSSEMIGAAVCYHQDQRGTIARKGRPTRLLERAAAPPLSSDNVRPPSAMDVYESQLARIVSSLSRRGLSVAVRGEAASRFVYAKASRQAVEVSRDGTGFFVEFFEEPVEAPVRYLEQVTLDDATTRTIEWLSGVKA